MTRYIDFVYLAGSCPSDGSPEYTFKHRLNFSNEYAKIAFARAMETIRKYGLRMASISSSSPLKTAEQIDDFVKKVRDLVPESFNITTIYSNKHGKILYQKSIRFPEDIDKVDLEKMIATALPIDLQKEKGRPVSSYFMDVAL